MRRSSIDAEIGRGAAQAQSGGRPGSAWTIGRKPLFLPRCLTRNVFRTRRLVSCSSFRRLRFIQRRQAIGRLRIAKALSHGARGRRGAESELRPKRDQSLEVGPIPQPSDAIIFSGHLAPDGIAEHSHTMRRDRKKLGGVGRSQPFLRFDGQPGHRITPRERGLARGSARGPCRVP